MITVEIKENQGGQRLDRFLKKYLKTAPLSLIYRMIRKDIKLNGKRAKNDTVIKTGDELTLYISEEKLEEFLAKPERKKAKKEFDIIYEDEHILIVDKPYGLLTHGDSKEKKNTLANQVINYLYEKGDYEPAIDKTFTPAPANRLDRNTSGLVIFGKSYTGIKEMNRYLRKRGFVDKYYLTIVIGKMDETLKLQDKMIKNESKNKVKVLPVNSQKGSIMETIVRPIKSNGEYTFTEIELVTGRTHQIRAHLAKAGFPIIGDKKYGNAQNNGIMLSTYGLSSQFLHAYKLVFGECDGKLAYLSGKSFECPLPKRLKTIGESINVIK